MFPFRFTSGRILVAPAFQLYRSGKVVSEATALVPRRIILASLLASSLPSVSIGAPSGAASPRVVLIEEDPWAMVVGSDSPRFVLYGDGTAIFLSGTGYKSVRLNASEVDALLSKLKTKTMPKGTKSYDVSTSTDQPTAMLIVLGEGKPSLTRVYGALDQKEIRARVPKTVVAAYDTLCAFEHPAARPWLPEWIEVMIWPYEYAPEASIVWPKRWPDLRDRRTVKRGADAYSLFLPSAEYPELQRFLARQKPKGAVEIGGRKWAVSTRFPFPGERLWMGGSSRG